MTSRPRQSLYVASVGLEMGIAMAIGVLGGWYLDNELDTKPLLLILGFVLGLGAAVKAILDAARAMNREETADEPERPGKD